MKPDAFKVSVEKSKTTGELLAAYVRVQKGTVARTKELVKGRVFADYGKCGEILGVEILSIDVAL